MRESIGKRQIHSPLGKALSPKSAAFCVVLDGRRCWQSELKYFQEQEAESESIHQNL